jgi:hypothetical protein
VLECGLDLHPGSSNSTLVSIIAELLAQSLPLSITLDKRQRVYMSNWFSFCLIKSFTLPRRPVSHEKVL